MLTQAIEVPIYLKAQAGRRFWTAFTVAFSASLITHPMLWLVFPHIRAEYWIKVTVLEVAVFAVEALFLRIARVENPVQWALLANAASAGVGFLLNLVT